MELLGRSYQRYYDFPEGRIGVMADIYVEEDAIELRNLMIYPVGVGVESLPIGVGQLLQVRRRIDDDARQLGFQRLRITADRLTGANPGRKVNVWRQL